MSVKEGSMEGGEREGKEKKMAGARHGHVIIWEREEVPKVSL